jgi:uncharacterized protein YehS (DUF1456 family)
MQVDNILQKIIKVLNLDEESILEIYRLESFDIESEVSSYERLGVFLDGLIQLKRGSGPKRDSATVELTNNLILKKLRIALELKEAEIEIIFGLGEVELTKQQLSSLFRNQKHKNFRLASDELLMAFLDGLDEFYFVGDIDE